MLGVLANHHGLTMTLDDLALFANFLDRRPYFHSVILLFSSGELFPARLSCRVSDHRATTPR